MDNLNAHAFKKLYKVFTSEISGYFLSWLFGSKKRSTDNLEGFILCALGIISPSAASSLNDKIPINAVMKLLLWNGLFCCLPWDFPLAFPEFLFSLWRVPWFQESLLLQSSSVCLWKKIMSPMITSSGTWLLFHVYIDFFIWLTIRVVRYSFSSPSFSSQAASIINSTMRRNEGTWCYPAGMHRRAFQKICLFRNR